MNRLLVFVLCFLLYEAQSDSAIFGELVNVEVSRRVLLQSQLEECTTIVKIVNTGKELAEHYVLAFPIEYDLCYLEVRAENKKLRVEPLVLDHPSNSIFYQAKFRNPLESDNELVLTINTVASNALTPLPAEGSQNDPFYALYKGSHYLFSPYRTHTATTKLTLSSPKILSQSKTPTNLKMSVDGSLISYTQLEKQIVAPFFNSPLNIHFLMKEPFVVFTKIIKDVYVSHWGNIAVEEHLWLVNKGPRLKGSFSRQKYSTAVMMNTLEPGTSFRSISVDIPPEAYDIYYRDNIGNISTSATRRNRSGKELELSPRFPMMGGWKANFYYGYNIPSETSLGRYEDGTLGLRIPFVNNFKKAVIEDYTVRVILPDGCYDIEVSCPFPVTETTGVYWSYLDVAGRPTVELSLRNVVHPHNKMFRVTYSTGHFALLRQPFLAFTAFMAFFLVAVFYFRMDWSLAGRMSKRMRVLHAWKTEPTLDGIVDIHQKFTQLYHGVPDLEAIDLVLRRLDEVVSLMPQKTGSELLQVYCHEQHTLRERAQHLSQIETRGSKLNQPYNAQLTVVNQAFDKLMKNEDKTQRTPVTSQ